MAVKQVRKASAFLFYLFVLPSLCRHMLNISLSKLFEKLDDTNAVDSIPLKCYEFFSAKSKTEQEQLYRILMEMDKYKSE